MKKLISLFMFLLFAKFVFAQLPKQAEDISPLLIGEKIPVVSLQTIQNQAVETKNIFNKPTVLVVYRGGWCPYCNTHLAALGESEAEILKLGYQIVAVSPDSPENLKASAEKNKLAYQLLSDSKGLLIKALGIAFEAPENYKKIIQKSSNGENENFLPAPAVFVVNSESEIEFLFISPNFKKRISKDLLLAVLGSLSKK